MLMLLVGETDGARDWITDACDFVDRTTISEFHLFEELLVRHLL